MKELIESKWEEILSLLETEYDISSIMINTWIRSLKIYEVKNNTVYFYVDEKLGENALKFLKRKEFDIFLLSSIRETLNDSTIDIVIDEKKNLIESDEEARKESVQKSDSYKEAVSRSNLNPKYTFDTFIVGEGNRHAHATCLAVADLPDACKILRESLSVLCLFCSETCILKKDNLAILHSVYSCTNCIVNNL